MGKNWIDCLEDDHRRLQEEVQEKNIEIVRLTKVSSDLTEANHKKKNRIEHQKQHIKRLQESIAKLKEDLRIARGDLTKEERYSQDFIDGTFERRQDNA